VVNKITSNSDSQHGGPNSGDVERMLCGAGESDEYLGRLTSLVEALRRVGKTGPTEAEVQLFAAEAAKLVPVTADRSVSRPAPARSSAARRRRRRSAFASALAALVVMLSGFGGLAYAANGAVPGDPLYGLDLALEKAGIGDGGLNERLIEASRLVERGRVQEGLALAGDSMAEAAVGNDSLGAAADSLRAAARVAADNQNLKSSEVIGMLAEQLRLMASVKPAATEFGKAVQALVDRVTEESQANGDPGQGQGQTTDDTNAGTGTGQGPTDQTQGNGSGSGGTGGSGQPK
jgi:hypothetical protein